MRKQQELECGLVAYHRERFLEELGLTGAAIEEAERQGQHGLAVLIAQSRRKITGLFNGISRITANWFGFQKAGTL